MTNDAEKAETQPPEPTLLRILVRDLIEVLAEFVDTAVEPLRELPGTFVLVNVGLLILLIQMIGYSPRPEEATETLFNGLWVAVSATMISVFYHAMRERQKRSDETGHEIPSSMKPHIFGLIVISLTLLSSTHVVTAAKSFLEHQYTQDNAPIEFYLDRPASETSMT